jgi:hypothetical protein
VHTVSKLHKNDPDILSHRQYHLLKVFRLRFCFGLKLKMCQLRYTINDIRDGGSKLGFNCLIADFCIFNYVMQHGGHQTLMIHMHRGKNT